MGSSVAKTILPAAISNIQTITDEKLLNLIYEEITKLPNNTQSFNMCVTASVQHLTVKNIKTYIDYLNSELWQNHKKYNIENMVIEKNNIVLHLKLAGQINVF